MEKINLSELLKDCPIGMELDCLLCNSPIKLEGVFGNEETYPIRAVGKDGFHHIFTAYGSSYNNDDAKCVIFPKGKTTWEGFVPSPCKFKDGDIVFYNDTIAIFKEWGDETLFRSYVSKFLRSGSLLCANNPLFGKSVRKEIRFATEEEKQNLFQEIKDNGYKWNAETKTLEKLLKFKVGDKVIKKGEYIPGVITHIDSDLYYKIEHNGTGITYLNSKYQDEWELFSNKFDITTLKPFDKVLVRTNNFTPTWTIDFYDGYRPNKGGYFTPFAVTGGNYFQQCIPYEGNEHLLGTTNDCDEFYKIWE